MKTVIYSLNDIEGIIGGSSLDDLRDIMGLDALEDDDITFTLISDPDIDLSTEYSEFPPKYTLLAHYTKSNINDYKYVFDNSHLYFEWKEYIK